MRAAQLFSLCAGASSFLLGVYAWGAAGHQIVATVAQMYLHPDVLPIICDILDLNSTKCHLSSVATWADQNRMHMRWSAALHYVGATDDYPSQTCAFPGEHKWAGKPQINVLDAIKNTTSLLQAWVNNDAGDAVASEALKFLIHFVGDMHQPLHLTGRARGGNSIGVLFDQRHTNLHSVWDTYLLSKAIRMVPQNYSRPIPHIQVEDALQGAIYDSYIRRILLEGVFDSWSDDITNWLICPTPTSPSTAKALNASGALTFPDLWKSAFGTIYGGVQTIMSKLNPRMGVDILADGPIVCPYHWGQSIHALNCDIVWPAEVDDPRFDIRFDFASHGCTLEDIFDDLSETRSSLSPKDRARLLQLDSPEYSGVIAQRMIVERVLAQGGIRLAGILNYIFAPKDDENRQGLFIINIEA